MCGGSQRLPGQRPPTKIGTPRKSERAATRIATCVHSSTDAVHLGSVSLAHPTLRVVSLPCKGSVKKHNVNLSTYSQHILYTQILLPMEMTSHSSKAGVGSEIGVIRFVRLAPNKKTWRASAAFFVLQFKKTELEASPLYVSIATVTSTVCIESTTSG